MRTWTSYEAILPADRLHDADRLQPLCAAVLPDEPLGPGQLDQVRLQDHHVLLLRLLMVGGRRAGGTAGRADLPEAGGGGADGG